MLGLEGLEDRMVMSTATLAGSTLLVNASPGHFEQAGPRLPLEVAHIRDISIFQDAVNPAKVDVVDSGKVLGSFPIGSIKTIDIHVAGLDSVTVDDRIATLGIIHPVPMTAALPSLPTFGGPVALTSLKAINISGSGSLNSFALERNAILPEVVPHALAGGAQAASAVGPSVSVSLNRLSNLGLSLENVELGRFPPVSLTIIAPRGKFNPSSPTTPTGSETVSFPGGFTSQVSYSNFASVSTFSGIVDPPATL
jgi:hypothetical protein